MKRNRFPKGEDKSEKLKKILLKLLKKPIAYCLLPTAYCLLLTTFSYSAESIDISAEELEYNAKTNTYIARSSARIVAQDILLIANEITLDRATSDAVAIGDVYYEDNETVIKADRIELNLETKLGTIYNSYIFYKKDNYHLRGGDLRRLDEKSYHLNKATVTTCDAIPPPWHISGRDIKAIKHKHLTARDTTFYIKNIPVFYTPYFWMPLTKKRQTGFLVPSIGSSTTKGFFYKQGFFWAIEDNKDLTLYLDYFSKKGFGKGLEYRYIINPDSRGNLWVYHLRDNELERDFFEFKTHHDLKLPSDVSGYLRVNTINTFDYYSILGSTSLRDSSFSSLKSINLSALESLVFDIERSERLRKYLESNLYLSRPFQGAKAYLLGQYRQSLEGSSKAIPQSLPEVGFILNTFSKGPASMNITIKANNFLKEEGQGGQRIDINPNLYLGYGRAINITQRISIRETAYLLNNPSEDEERLLLELSSKVSTRFLKRYSSLIFPFGESTSFIFPFGESTSFLHAIEPSLEYKYTPILNNGDVTIFDSIDSTEETSTIIYSITNRFEGLRYTNLSSRLRLSQRYNLLEDERPFTPLLLEGGLSSNLIDFSINASYNFYEAEADDVFTNIKIKSRMGYIGIGKDFRRSTGVDQYTLEGRINGPLPIFGKDIPFTISGKIWYDMKNSVVQESTISTIYRKQCWALTASIVKRPEEYQISFGIEFTGLGALRW